MCFNTNSTKLFLKTTVARGSSRSYFSFDVFVNGKLYDALDNYSHLNLPLDYTEEVYQSGEFSKEFISACLSMCGFLIYPNLLFFFFPPLSPTIHRWCWRRVTNILFVGFTLGSKSSQNMKVLFRKETTNWGLHIPEISCIHQVGEYFLKFCEFILWSCINNHNADYL